MAMTIVQPPDDWRPDLPPEARAYEWKYLAGTKSDGTEKSSIVHQRVRNKIRQKIKFDNITAKSSRERTYDEHLYIKKLEEARVQRTKNSIKFLEKNQPRVTAMRKVSDERKYAKLLTAKLKKAKQFAETNSVDLGKPSLSDDDAFQYVLKLIDDVESDVGKAIFHAFGMSLRNAFWEGKSSSAMYALMSRGDATIGGNKSEYIGFLVGSNNKRKCVITRGDTKNSFKYGDKEFKNLQLTYVPIRTFDNYADVTAMESAFQLFFDFLPIGSMRLWMKSGNGRSTLPLRKCDKTYITKSGVKKLVFMFGITILKNVEVLESYTDTDGKESVKSITGGLGMTCNVNQPVRRNEIIKPSQKDALERHMLRCQHTI